MEPKLLFLERRFMAPALVTIAIFSVSRLYSINHLRVFSKPFVVIAFALDLFKSAKENEGKRGQVSAVKSARLSGYGMLASSLGDLFLELNFIVEQDFFLPGLIAFFFAHIFFSWAFIVRDSEGKFYLFPVATVIALCIFIFVLPNLPGQLVIPVAVYTLVIAVMFWRSLVPWLSAKPLPGTSPSRAVLGALSFTISDSIIAINKFSFPVPWSDFFIMTTYWVGQWLIAASARR